MMVLPRPLARAAPLAHILSMLACEGTQGSPRACQQSQLVELRVDNSVLLTGSCPLHEVVRVRTGPDSYAIAELRFGPPGGTMRCTVVNGFSREFNEYAEREFGFHGVSDGSVMVALSFDHATIRVGPADGGPDFSCEWIGAR